MCRWCEKRISILSETARGFGDDNTKISQNKKEGVGQASDDRFQAAGNRQTAKILADLARGSGSDSTQHKTLRAAQQYQTTPKSDVVSLNKLQTIFRTGLTCYPTLAFDRLTTREQESGFKEQPVSRL